jgi:hypothetical protein
MGQGLTESLVDIHNHLDPAVIQKITDLVLLADHLFDLKITGLNQTITKGAAVNTVVFIKDGRLDMLDISGYGIAEHNDLKNRHDKDDPPDTGVPENLDKLFNQDLFDPFKHD